MPLYVCNTERGLLDATAKAAIATAITRIHCDVTAAPPAFVHAFFFDEAPQFPREEKALYVSGTIRKGRTDEQKRAIAESIRGALIEHGGVEAHRVDVMIRETPASWVLEGGEIMPEPGGEAAWFAAHEAKRGS